MVQLRVYKLDQTCQHTSRRGDSPVRLFLGPWFLYNDIRTHLGSAYGTLLHVRFSHDAAKSG